MNIANANGSKLSTILENRSISACVLVNIILEFVFAFALLVNTACVCACSCRTCDHTYIQRVSFAQADRRDVLMHEPNYNNVVHKATEFLESSGPGPQKEEISAKLDDIKTRWDELKRKTNERHAQLEDVLPLAQKYHDNSQNVKDVVTLAETELGSHAAVSPDVEIAKQELQTIKV